MRDRQLMMARSQDIGAQAVGNLLSTDTIDLGETGVRPASGDEVPNDPGRGDPLQAEFRIVDEAVTSGGAATVQFQVGECDDDAGTNFTVLAETAAIGKAALVVGYSTVVDIPKGISREKLKARTVVAGADLTAGHYSAELLPFRRPDNTF